ncbi:helicase-associated domain-containing protein [Leucobacter sp. HY1910]
MSGTLALASAIAANDREGLARLVQARRPLAASGVADPIGLATELLRPESIARALAPLDRATLRVLAAHDWLFSPRITERLRALGLVGADTSHDHPIALPEVDDALRAALAEVNVSLELDVDVAVGLDTLALEPCEPGEAPAASWFTPALTLVGEVAECLRVIGRDGLRLNRSGSVGVAAARELADRAAIAQSAAVLVLRQLDYAHLTVAAGSRLVPAAAAGDWLASPHPDRWLMLARSFLADMPRPLCDSLDRVGRLSNASAANSAANRADGAATGADLGDAGARLGDEFPLLPAADLATARQYVLDAEDLGLTVTGKLTPIAQRIRAHEPITPADAAALLPAAAAGVYLQPDLTVLAPGPLDPAAESQLAELTRPEQIGPASMRRVTEASLATAFERGVTPESAADMFARLSLTGVPQPLEYLLRNVAERVGRIVVFEHSGDAGRSRIRVAQQALAETVLVDRQLQHLQLTRSPNTVERRADTDGADTDGATSTVVLFSRLRPEHVVSAFNEARYHASLASDAPEAAHEGPAFSGHDPDHAAAGAAAADAEPGPIEAMIERVFAAAHTEPAAAAFTRRLELAIRDRAAVRVTAEARGQRRTFTLTPVALTDGRLRATDVGAGVERTLPVSMIVAVDSA